MFCARKWNGYIHSFGLWLLRQIQIFLLPFSIIISSTPFRSGCKTQMHIDLFYQQCVIAPVEQWTSSEWKKKGNILKLLHRLNAKDNVRMEKINDNIGDDDVDGHDDGNNESGKYVRQFPIYSSIFLYVPFLWKHCAQRFLLFKCTS